MEGHLSISHSSASSLIKRKGTETHPGALPPKFNTPESVIHSEHRAKKPGSLFLEWVSLTT